MRIRALYDRRGRILAAVQMQALDPSSKGTPAPQPQPQRGQRIGMFAVPRECADLTFAQVCVEMKVVTRARQASLAPGALRSRRKGNPKHA